jgi:membrane associated rhomboid family serine protease
MVLTRVVSILSKTKTSILKLLFVLVALPCMMTWLHVENSLQNLISWKPAKGNASLSGQICFISTYPDSFDMRTFIPNRGGAEVLDSESRSDANVRRQSWDGVYVRQDEHTFVLSANMQRVNSGYMKWPSAMTFFSKYRALIRKEILSRQTVDKELARLQYASDMEKFCLVDIGNEGSNSVISCDSQQDALKMDSNQLCPRTDHFGSAWTSIVSNRGMVQVRVYCPTISKGHETDNKGGKKSRRARKKKVLLFILQHPITALLLVGQVYLSFLYWNHSTPITTVAYIYSLFVQGPHFEIWRAFSSAFSHFALIHLGFNMMTLHSLGTILENNSLDAPISSLSSIEFLAYNLALVIATIATLTGFTYLQIQLARRNNQAQRENQLLNTPVIGFSGVLFAWMVVQTLDYAESCPLPSIFPDLCFATHTLPILNIRWNVSPMVSLIFTQVLIRNASFMGHLSGIICGYTFIHIGVVPYKLVVPNVLIPCVIVGHFWFIQGIKPSILNTRLNTHDNVTDDDVNEYPITSVEDILLNPLVAIPRRSSEISTTATAERDLSPTNIRNIQTLRRVQRLMLVTCIFSPLFVEYDLVVGQVSVLILFYLSKSCFESYLVHSRNGLAVKEQRKQQLSTVLHGFFCGVVIIIVVDSMTLGCWMTSGASIWMSLTFPHKMFFQRFTYFVLIVIGRLIASMIGLIASAKVLSDEGLVFRNGLFDNIFGFVYRNAQRIAEHALVPDVIPFEGQGFILGSTSTRTRTINPHV